MTAGGVAVLLLFLCLISVGLVFPQASKVTGFLGLFPSGFPSMELEYPKISLLKLN